MSYPLQRGAGHSDGGGHCGPNRTSKSSWAADIRLVNQLKMSPYVMQSNMDFSIEGSVSANCHGWQYGAQPIGAGVEFHVDRGDGPRPAKGNVKSAAIGGYGLCGRITNVEYEKIPNWRITSNKVVGMARDLVGHDYDADMLNIHLDRDWLWGVANIHRYETGLPPVISDLKDHVPWIAKTLVRHAPTLRWIAQKRLSTDKASSRNAFLYTSVRHFQWPNQRLAEVFVPTKDADDFVMQARGIIKDLDLINTTVRDVREDTVSMLPYAKTDVRGFVMLIQQRTTDADTLRRLYDLAIDFSGTYYLPYSKDIPTVEQFQKAYPSWKQFKEMTVIESDWSRKFLA